MHGKPEHAVLGERDRAAAGFSLVELLVVVAIIGVLAAIAVPSYLGLQNRSRDASVRADLEHARTALTAFSAGHDGDLPSAVTRNGTAAWAATSVDLTPYGWSRGTATVDLAYSSAGSRSWCVLATSATGSTWIVGSTVPVTRAAACPAP